MILTGVVTTIIFCNEETNFYILVADVGDEEVTLKGTFGQVEPELTYEFHVKEVMHPVYGRQYEVESYRIVMPTDVENIVQFLASGIFDGIGPVTAERIVAKFGEDTLDVMRLNPQRLRAVEGIGQATLKKIIKSFSEHLEAEQTLFFLSGLGLSAKMSFAIYEVYGKDSEAQLKSNPYNLIADVRGMGFNRVDALAEQLGFSRDGIERVTAYIHYYLRIQAAAGRVFTLREDLFAAVVDKIGSADHLVEEALQELYIRGDVVIERDADNDQTRIYTRLMYDTEIGIVREIARLQSGLVKDVTYSNNFSDLDLTAEQQDIVDQGLNYKLFILTGGPGTGKTTILKEWVMRLEHSDMSYSLCAPTGRAASRMEEVIGRPASTVHRLLEYKYQEDSRLLLFNRNGDNPLQSDVVIVDEVSMIDAPLFLSLLMAIPTDSRLILIGDVNQLPAVGPGNVLGDLIDSEVVKKSKLTQIHRQAADSLILTNAHAILNGDEIAFNKKDKDCFFIRAQSNRAILDALLKLVSERLPTYYDINPIDSITVLTPLRGGTLGAEGLNLTLQEALNPGGEKFYNRFRIGDKVMQNRNNYNIKWTRENSLTDGEGIFNGEIGRVTGMTDKGIRVRFSDGKYAIYNRELIEDLVLAYAMTIHKSQGNEFDYVVIPMYRIPDVIKSNNLIYTAITRAKKHLTMIGEHYRLDELIRSRHKLDRHSTLDKRLSDVFEKID
ncbi:MAG: ATP-dependent RecD-like DNA helicase [Clostridiales bacterium]|nr:MAG: ATP-dependent RecD-like DNA helicase [Clostridiales bacterium]